MKYHSGLINGRYIIRIRSKKGIVYTYIKNLVTRDPLDWIDDLCQDPEHYKIATYYRPQLKRFLKV